MDLFPYSRVESHRRKCAEVPRHLAAFDIGIERISIWFAETIFVNKCLVTMQMQSSCWYDAHDQHQLITFHVHGQRADLIFRFATFFVWLARMWWKSRENCGGDDDDVETKWQVLITCRSVNNCFSSSPHFCQFRCLSMEITRHFAIARERAPASYIPRRIKI